MAKKKQIHGKFLASLVRADHWLKEYNIASLRDHIHPNFEGRNLTYGRADFMVYNPDVFQDLLYHFSNHFGNYEKREDGTFELVGFNCRINISSVFYQKTGRWQVELIPHESVARSEMLGETEKCISKLAGVIRDYEQKHKSKE